MAKLKDIGVGHDYVKSMDKDAIIFQVETWINSDNVYFPALTVTLFVTIIISNNLTEYRRK